MRVESEKILQVIRKKKKEELEKFEIEEKRRKI